MPGKYLLKKLKGGKSLKKWWEIQKKRKNGENF